MPTITNNTITVVNAFSHLTVTSTPKTLDEAIYIGKLKDAALKAALEAALDASKGELSLTIGDYSKGTVTVKGINRWGIALYPSQAVALDKFIRSGKLLAFINDPVNIDKLRCCAVAAEYAEKSGCKWATGASKKDEATADYRNAYARGYAEAAASPELVASPR